ncbi:MAG: glycerophosphodiester phosphodiesterase [Deltaproteobacteria bacterium]|nr:glycerophosphodiester phosphodiesterase [Deltaproteobacteria bacterium]
MKGLFKRFPIFAVIILAAFVAISGCIPTPENTEVVVSDGITNNDRITNPDEILPNATVYQIANKDKKSLLKYLLADKVKGLEVQFYVREFGGGENDWICLADTETLITDEEGRITLPGIRQWLSEDILDKAPIDLQLRAKAIFEGGGYVTDDNGMIRILSTDTETNPQVVLTDHDNTLHLTGGLNTIKDCIEFLNWAKKDWPLVDDYVVDAIHSLHDSSKDIVIVSGMPTEIRALCREQVNNHFEDGGIRFMPIVIKSDLPYEHGNEFKAAALGILKNLYGVDSEEVDNSLAMVGDTVREDGYGAFANKIFYIPFQVSYFFNLSLLDSEGYGYIDPVSIAWDWSQVMDIIASGDPVTNFFLRNENGFLNIAHRGGADLRPENTIEAYQYALEVGADSLEGDLHATSDGVIVVSHDATVDRCTNGSGYIKEMTFEDLRALDAGYWYTTNGINYPYRGQGLQIPTLEEVFSDPVLNKSPMCVEIKQSEPSIVDDVLNIIQTYDMEDKLIMGSFNKESLDEIRAKAESQEMNIVTSFCEDEVLQFFLTPLSVMLATGYTPPGKVLQVPIEYELGDITVQVINNSFMNKARYLGLNVQIWTINDPDEMRWLMDEKKVDGIMTDNPELLEAVINE